MTRRPFMPLAVVCLLFSLASVALWVDSCWHWNVVLTPMIHRRRWGVITENGMAVMIMAPPQRIGWSWERLSAHHGALIGERRLSGFGFGRAFPIDYLFFPFWSVSLVWILCALWFATRRRKMLEPGFPVVASSPPN